MPKQTLEALKQQRDKINHRIQAVEARERTIQRKQDLQRKILVGGYVLEKAEREGQLEQLYAEMSKVLMREIDRQLFEAVPNERSLPKKVSKKTANLTQAQSAKAEVK